MENVCDHYRNCPIKKFFEKGKLDKKWIDGYCLKRGLNCERRSQAERGYPNPENMLPDGSYDFDLIWYI